MISSFERMFGLAGIFAHFFELLAFPLTYTDTVFASIANVKILVVHGDSVDSSEAFYAQADLPVVLLLRSQKARSSHLDRLR